MCGIAGLVSLDGQPITKCDGRLHAMSRLIAHRGPDGHGVWSDARQACGLAHRRLAIIDLSPSGHQPMVAPSGSAITYNGEIYNYVELMDQLRDGWTFRSTSDTETILAAYAKWGTGCLEHLRGMFAFALWDGDRLFAARDRFGIKPFYYAMVDGVFYFASEIKALLPVLPEVATDPAALAEYMAFQYTIGDRSLFKHVHVLLPGHGLTVANGKVKVFRYWDVRYEIDWSHTRPLVRQPHARVAQGFRQGPLALRRTGRRLYLRGHRFKPDRYSCQPGKTRRDAWAFMASSRSSPAMTRATTPGRPVRRAVSRCTRSRSRPAIFAITSPKVIYHLDHPVAGPGSFPQYMVSKLAAEHVKVVLGGQGGDEIFGGYARYLIAYLEQSLKAAIDGTYMNGNFVVTPELIIPNLTVLQEYKPLIKQVFSKGLFGPLDERYFRLIDRSADMANEVNWNDLDRAGVFERYQAIFNSERNVRKEAYFDSMTHFDFKCLLPALLQVEDRMSMAHGLESRVPLLDHSVVEFAATIPADIKFTGGQVKHFLKSTFAAYLPKELMQRRDKMGFPVPLKEWFGGALKDMVVDIFSTQKSRSREFFNSEAILSNFDKTERFSRKGWGLLSLELWHQLFHDRAAEYRRMVNDDAESARVAAQ